MKVRKAIIAAAGYGTRFLPATKAVAKEMFPIYNKPTLQYIVEEMSEAGIEELLIVIGRGKEMIMNHFDKNYELETELEKKGKLQLLQIAQKPNDLLKIQYIKAKEMKGFADAIYQAKEFCSNEPFVVAVGDELMFEGNSFKELIDCYNKYNKTTICTSEVSLEDTKKYGIVSGKRIDSNVVLLDKIIEKPQSNPPSNLCSTGRYVFSPEIFDEIEKLYSTTEQGQEIILTEAIEALAEKQKVVACTPHSVRFDTGDRLGFVKANLYVALKDEKINAELRDFLKNIVEE